MKIKRLNESFELVKPEETIDTVEETLTEASVNPWDKLVKAYPELEDDSIITEEIITEEANPWDKLVDMYPELADSAVEESFDDEEGNREYCDKCGTCPKCDDGEEDMDEMLTESCDYTPKRYGAWHWGIIGPDKLLVRQDDGKLLLFKSKGEAVAYIDTLCKNTLTEGNNVSSQLPPSIDSFLQDIAQIHGTISYGDIMDHKYTEEDIKKLRRLRKQWREEAQYDIDGSDTILSNIADKVASILKVSALEEDRPDPSSNVNSFEYDDQYEFDNEDDVVEQDRMHAALYGGDREYCDKCGSKLVMDEWGGSCPKCNAEEVFDAKYDDDVSHFDDALDEAKEKVSDHAKKILSPLTRNEAIKKAQELLKSNPDCDGVCYGIGRDFFEPYCITSEEAERIAASKQLVHVLWNRNK